MNVSERFVFDSLAAFVNGSNAVNCGSDLINNSTGTHNFGTGLYTFTGTTLGGSQTLNLSNSNLSFQGSVITLGDSDEGDGNLIFNTVSFANANAGIILGKNTYAGTITFNGNVSVSGSNASLLVNSGTVSWSGLNLSGSASSASLLNSNGRNTFSGSVNCGNSLTINTDCDITGTLTVGGSLYIYGSDGTGGDDINTLTGAVTVAGNTVSITAGSTTIGSSFAHTSTAIGASSTIGGTFTADASGVSTSLNAESITFAGTPRFHTLSLSRSTGSAGASADIYVGNTLSLAKDLTMASSYALSFGASAPLSSTSGTGEVIGSVRRPVLAAGSYTFNGASTTLLAPLQSTAQNFEFHLVKSAPDAQAVTRYYDIRNMSGNFVPAASTYSLGLQYFDSELNGNNENLLLMAYGNYGTALENQYSKLTSSVVSTTANIVTYSFDGILSFDQRYTLADLNAALPVELVSFTALRIDGAVLLRWRTATELNNEGFDIERRTGPDGAFETIHFVAGSGTKNTPTDYRFTDQADLHGEVSYRLKQIDRDGSISYSDVVTLAGGKENGSGLRNYPNPFNPSTTISFSAPQRGNAVVWITNSLGQKVREIFHGSVEDGEAVTLHVNAADMPGGTYFYSLQIGSHVETGKMLLLK